MKLRLSFHILWMTICQNCYDFPPYSLLRVTKTIFRNWTPCVVVTPNKWLFCHETLFLVLSWNCRPCLKRDIYIFYFRRWKLKFFFPPHEYILNKQWLVDSVFTRFNVRRDEIKWSEMKKSDVRIGRWSGLWNEWDV